MSMSRVIVEAAPNLAEAAAIGKGVGLGRLDPDEGPGGPGGPRPQKNAGAGATVSASAPTSASANADETADVSANAGETASASASAGVKAAQEREAPADGEPGVLTPLEVVQVAMSVAQNANLSNRQCTHLQYGLAMRLIVNGAPTAALDTLGVLCAIGCNYRI